MRRERGEASKKKDLPWCLEKKQPKKNLEVILKRSINLRTRSDAKIGLLLSAGIDSNLIRKNITKVDYFNGRFKNDFDYKYLKKKKN